MHGRLGNRACDVAVDPERAALAILRAMTLQRAAGVPALVGLSMLCSHAAAETYYVAEGGDNGATGLMGAPWETLQYAANQVGAGDTVIVAAGNYVGFQLTTAGEDGLPITFSADAGAVIDEDNPSTPDGINLEGASYAVIEGFEVVGTTRAGIRCALSDHVVIRNNTSRDNGRWGILTGFCNDVESKCSFT